VTRPLTRQERQAARRRCEHLWTVIADAADPPSADETGAGRMVALTFARSASTDLPRALDTIDAMESLLRIAEQFVATAGLGHESAIAAEKARDWWDDWMRLREQMGMPLGELPEDVEP
jgi:hypothetical protein